LSWLFKKCKHSDHHDCFVCWLKRARVQAWRTQRYSIYRKTYKYEDFLPILRLCSAQWHTGDLRWTSIFSSQLPWVYPRWIALRVRMHVNSSHLRRWNFAKVCCTLNCVEWRKPLERRVLCRYHPQSKRGGLTRPCGRTVFVVLIWP